MYLSNGQSLGLEISKMDYDYLTAKVYMQHAKTFKMNIYQSV